MPSPPLVSIILPVYNAEKYLAESIESIIKQTYTNFELLILNDGSSDNSLKIINKFKDNRIKVISSKNNRGLIYQLNLGLAESKGKYTARMDADDIAYKHRIEKQINFLEKHKNIGVCGSFVRIITSTGKEKNIWRMKIKHDDIKAELLEGAVLCHPSLMFRSSVIKNNNIKYSKNRKHIEDYELWTRLINLTKFHVLPEVLMQYRVHENQVSAENINTQTEKMNHLIESQLANIINKNEIEFNIIKSLLDGDLENFSLSKFLRYYDKIVEKFVNKSYSYSSIKKLFAKRVFYYLADSKKISKYNKKLFFFNIRKFLNHLNFRKLMYIAFKT